MSKALEAAIDRLEYLALARAQNATDRNDAKAAAAIARAAISAMRPAPKLTEEDRARMKTVAEEIRGYAGHDAPWLAKRSEELLSLIDKLTEAG